MMAKDIGRDFLRIFNDKSCMRGTQASRISDLPTRLGIKGSFTQHHDGVITGLNRLHRKAVTIKSSDLSGLR